MRVNNQRLVDMEARLADLECALETQAVVIGRLLAMGAGEDDRGEWLLQLCRDMRVHPTPSPGTARLMRALQYGSCVTLPPELAALAVPK